MGFISNHILIKPVTMPFTQPNHFRAKQACMFNVNWSVDPEFCVDGKHTFLMYITYVQRFNQHYY